MEFMVSVLRSTWLKVFIYILIGVGVNTASPHFPQFNGPITGFALLHSITQYVLSVMLWPLSLWGPTFTVGKWAGV